MLEELKVPRRRKGILDEVSSVKKGIAIVVGLFVAGASGATAASKFVVTRSEFERHVQESDVERHNVALDTQRVDLLQKQVDWDTDVLWHLAQDRQWTSAKLDPVPPPPKAAPHPTPKGNP